MKRLLTILSLIFSLSAAEEVRVLLVADAPAGSISLQTSSGTNWAVSVVSNSEPALWGFLDVTNGAPVSALISSTNGFQFVADVLSESVSGDLTVQLSSVAFASLDEVFRHVLAGLVSNVCWLACLLSVTTGALLFRFVSLRSQL